MRRRVLWEALAPLLLLQSGMWYVFLPRNLAGDSDFHSFYGAATLVRHGHAAQLYDFSWMQRLVAAPGPYIHPPYEVLAFLPLTLLEYKAAYLSFFVFNAMLLIAAAMLVLKACGSKDWQLALAVTLVFSPPFVALLRGQDSILVIFLFAAAGYCLQKDKDGLAGALVALALFRFQLAIPVALLLLAWRQWRFLRGFALSTIFVAGVSLLVVGPAGLLLYGDHLLSLVGGHPPPGYQQWPESMPNLRGLIESAGGNQPGARALIFLASAAVLFLAARRRPETGMGRMSLAVTAAALVGYHGYAQDLSVLLLPFLTLFVEAENPGNDRQWAPWLLLSTSVLVLPYRWAFLAALPVLGLLATQLTAAPFVSARLAAQAAKTSSKISSASA